MISVILGRLLGWRMPLEIMDTTEGGNLLTVKDVRLVAGQQLLQFGSAVCRRAARRSQIVKEEKLATVGALESQIQLLAGSIKV
jgi:uncharacterized membrane protein